MDEVVTGRNICEKDGIFTFCVKETDPMAKLILERKDEEDARRDL